MGKHAYLVMAHRYDETFLQMMKLIDYRDNDIFLHMDVKCTDYSEEKIREQVHFSNLYLTKRTDVRWGDTSQINTELLLLKDATNTGSYRYYHLISGQGLPIKSQKYIHQLLENDNLEYLEVVSDAEPENPVDYDRAHYYHDLELGQSRIDMIRADHLSVEEQKKKGVIRNADISFRKGSNWFSITDDLARYVVSKEDWIREVFDRTICADELFMQTVVRQSPFWDRLARDPSGLNYSFNLREIDWSRGNGMNPHIYTKEDAELLFNSKMLFARKFDCNEDKEIIDILCNRIMSEEN